jgi:hypothetical protein
MEENGETFADIKSNTMSDAEMDAESNSGYDSWDDDRPVIVWTKCNIYFPVFCGGCWWMVDVPRNPNGEPTGHIGR